MSLSQEVLQEHLDDPAVLCCRRPAGTLLSGQDFEDPTIFDDMVESNLMTLSDDGLSIRQALGATLASDAEALTQLTPDMLTDSVQKDESALEAVSQIQDKEATPASSKQSVESVPTINSDGTLHLHIDKSEGIDLDIPLGVLPSIAPAEGMKESVSFKAPAVEESIPDKVLRTLVKRDYPVHQVVLGSQTSYADGVLSIDRSLVDQAKESDSLVKDITMDVIAPNARHVYSNTIMDVIPIAAKAEGKLGEGITNVLSGAVFVLTGMDEAGVQIHEFGSCEGYMDEKIRFGRPGCPDDSDIMIRVDVRIEEGTGMERRGPFAAHSACDVIIRAIREKIGALSTEDAVNKEVFKDVRRKGRPRVVLVKEIMGQGAMHDNLLVPSEPCGVQGGEKNVDMGNVPVVLSPNEVLDGGIHALACIGPATKEITRHFFREPLVEALQNDEELDLTGVVFIGSPQVNDEKSFVSSRLGSQIEAMEVDGAIITTEGFGNNHIDFSENIEQIGSRGVPVVGVTFAAYQGQLVVGNPYMDAMIELNKDEKGFENEILADNTLTADDARRAILMLKNKMSGIPIEPPERRWDEAIIKDNQKLAR
ncbi:D-proline reductase (dithiol) proprotein PrdA [Bifidobacterium aquikefiri]|uniref:D-proline reductase (Dithiol) proprotein PrdA n=1 Tax=Bifidobacterium aquikefiri TaxID=1653207 RepID=A0A261G8B3_9BIFI|nr:D-proline reductase (dithiol) proprotein PrdA [Bifidobacterium aquikefiri]OZG67658.1 D-proline reductase (dithiol) proprotein PrdA [Bifidobacterium aquikefiri]